MKFKTHNIKQKSSMTEDEKKMIKDIIQEDGYSTMFLGLMFIFKNDKSKMEFLLNEILEYTKINTSGNEFLGYCLKYMRDGI